jgi:hypothetical protein
LRVPGRERHGRDLRCPGTFANTAATEAGQFNLADALALTLLYRDQDPSLFERAAIRWLSRFCRDARKVSERDAHLAFAAWMAIDGPHPERGHERYSRCSTRSC